MEKVTKNAYTLYAFRSRRGCLSYIVSGNATQDALIIDPSEEVGDEYERVIDSKNLALRYIVDTHTHADHVSAYPALKKFRAKYVMHGKAPSSRIDIHLKEGDTVTLGDLTFRILHTPGHASDTIALVLPDAVFTSDTLLIGGTGRTDLRKDSSADDLYDSIWNKIIPLGDDMSVYPGHDYKGRFVTTIGEERKTNQRLQLSREKFVELLDAHRPPLPELFEESVRKNSE